ncbi:MAG: Asp-tRNA(Asn)/Glu-tRNA(Gln) amidotransferase subunit GatB [Crocinitomicaceae bacterium]|nr:Asp-tRNA(Asn)/Glu-tRNA(Gln) amidotransferase subunit GatB [Crocinitomicaceae bacterium]
MEFNESLLEKYEAVIGLEVHIQLNTVTKAYSSDRYNYGDPPNTDVSVISLGHPGALPRFNKQVMNFAVKLGVALDCKITEKMNFARKNYFYPDLPKGYQITQDKTPICTGGSIKIKDDSGQDKKIKLTRIHWEEDAGKSIHDLDPFNTLVDLNRAGVPLLEIVSEPDIKTSEEAYNYLYEVRKLVRYLEICNGNMEEGSLRCDANISVMPKGSTTFGTKVEVKNMNSMRNVQKAIEFEIRRQILANENGEEIKQETRAYDALKNRTLSMRSKESDNDYRYFPEPDLPIIRVSQEYVNEVKKTMPPLPDALYQKFTGELQLSDYDSRILTDSKEVALYFEELIQHSKNYKSCANWLIGDIKSYLNEKAIDLEEFPVQPKSVAELVNIIDDGKISNSVAKQKIFPEMIASPEKSPLEIAQENNLIQDSNEDSIKDYILQVFENNPSEVERYKGGEKQLVGFFMGQLMKVSGGKADPKSANKLIRELLEQ